MADPDLVVETRDLRKSYGATEALRGLNFHLPRGSIAGFLGRNGAGKTTTMKILMGLTHPTSGSLRVLGLSPDSEANGVTIRSRTAFVSEDKNLVDYMTAEELVRFTASFYPQWDRDLEKNYLRVFELPAAAKVKDYSRGMRTKLAILLAVCRGSELLLLDEPTSGLDPVAIEQALQAVVAHAARGATVLFSSHQIAEVDQIADHLTIIDRGKCIVSGPLDDVRASYRRVQLVFENDAPDIRLNAGSIVRTERRGRTLSLLVSAGAADVMAEVQSLNPVSMDAVPVTLREIFLETTGQGE